MLMNNMIGIFFWTKWKKIENDNLNKLFVAKFEEYKEIIVFVKVNEIIIEKLEELRKFVTVGNYKQIKIIPVLRAI